MRTADSLRMLGLAAVWGASFMFMRMIVPVLGALPTAFFRVLLATGGLFAIALLLRIRLRYQGKLGLALLLGVVNSGIPFAMYSVAARVLPAGYSAIFNATTPLMGAVIGALFFSEKLTPLKVAGVFLGIAGVAILTNAGPVKLTPEVLMGAGACLIATACYGLGGFLTRKWISEKGGLDSTLLALGSQLGAVLLLLPFAAYSVLAAPPVSWGGSGVWLAMAGLGLACTAFAYIIYYRLIADISPTRSMTVTFLIPPFGVLWGVIFLNETLTLAHFVGGACICAAIWAMLRSPAKERKR
ncbi:DMT family transporter [Herbaspirillum sp. RTI4]|uniref:DMT family transporter n=1 Tax=Herbaspirillum sp. RTI4 TaxID=3048640 RepID=UPI002AB52BE8|nr:DMT family transporter [Herbaspirillum sp. RTI4]MDY7577221.1 DMT family transporter [Herbaspirillum sp. RTI4]MEA9980511.1 DMT family transporter [Herbaspirillum sp. RTI4]